MTRSAEALGSPGAGVTPVRRKRAGGAAAWLELAVEADIEAVEAVSEILGRVAPGGTSVEPAYVLVDEGLGARVDPTRPAIVRAYVPARDAASARRAAREVEAALGHLQAFGLRPIGELRTRLVDEADWADAWKAHFPVMRIGRRLVIRPTWRRHRAGPDDVVLALDPGMAFGTGPPSDDPALPGGDRGGGRSGRPRWRPRPRRRVRLGDPRDRGGPPGCGQPSWASTSTRSRSRRRSPTPGATGSPAGFARARAPCPARERPFDVVLANLIASVLIALAGPLRDELRPGGLLLASGIFADREDEVADAFRVAGLAVVERTSEGDWVALAVRRPI